MSITFTKETLLDFPGNIQREWTITNGIGGYAGSSILGAHNRTHQGYLIASYHPPVDRFMVFSKTHEKLTIGEKTYDFSTGQYAGEEVAGTVVADKDIPDAYKGSDTLSVEADFVFRKPIYRTGNDYLQEFTYDGNPHFIYQVGSLSITKTIFMVQNQNKTVVMYEIRNEGEAAEFTVTPLFNFREHSASSTVDTLLFDTEVFHNADKSDLHGILLYPKNQSRDYYIYLSASPSEITDRTDLYDVDMQFATEVENEVSGLDCNYTPYDITFQIPAHSRCTHALMCETGLREDLQQDLLERDLIHRIRKYYQESCDYYGSLLQRAGQEKDPFANTLILAANQFLAHRQSTGLMTVLAGLPWFTDWGRDTMIAFHGLTLCTRRFQEAADILKTFSMYVHHGMVPNMFPDNGEPPMYNTADASLWYFYAVDAYLKAVASDEEQDAKAAERFIRQEIYPSLKEILHAYEHGTDFSIYMDEDGLIHAGSGKDQVTWMDVRVGDWVVTPRHGAPVEINALWYNALKVMQDLALRFQDLELSTHCNTLSVKVQTSFCRKFWYADGGYLYDVIDGDECDRSLRPNQIYAVALPYTMLDDAKARSVVDVVERELLAGPGVRSLASQHPDYHPVYVGSLPKRDAAYHQGTAWGFLLGGFLTAYMKVHNYSSDAAAQALLYLDPVKQHLTENCVGSICEIFDGDAPHKGRGCYAQAWSVGETLRAYLEHIKPYLS